MALIKLTAFIGEQPRIIARLLPETGAKSAIDVRLNDGGLTPVRSDRKTAILETAGMKTIYRHGEEWLGWDQVVHASPGPVAIDRLYYTGFGTPKVRIEGVDYELAVAAPATAPSAAPDGIGSGDVVTRTYVYTFVTEFGEESEPSPASASVDWQNGQTVILSDLEVGDPARGVTKQRFYRSQTGSLGTYFYFIGERDTSAADFTDNVLQTAFQEPLPSADWNAPPAGLRGLTELPNGFFAAFVDNRVYFSEPYHPHAWPEKYVLTTTFPIVGLGAIGGVLVVLTTGFPYVIQGSHPSAMQMQKIEANYPCINERTIVDVGYAVVFATNDGFASVRGDGSITMISANLLDRDGYLALDPETMVASQINDQYVVFYDTLDPNGNRLAGALFINVTGQSFLVRSASIASAAWFDISDGGLYYQKTGSTDIYRLDDPRGIRKRLYWRSKEFILPFENNFGCIRIDSDNTVTDTDTSNDDEWIAEAIEDNQATIAAGTVRGELDGNMFNEYPVNGDSLIFIPRRLVPVEDELEDYEPFISIGVWCDGRKVATIGTSNRTVRLPSGFLGRKWEIDVSSTLKITQISMANTIDELRAGG